MRFRSPYLYGGYGLVPYGYGIPLEYGANLEDDTDSAGPPQAAPPPPNNDDGAAQYYEQSGPQVAEMTSPRYRPQYQGAVTVTEVHPQPATTLIFKDGRQPEQVHNYALTATTLYALDGDTRQDISLSLLNVPATVAANRAAGVDFSLPVSR